MRRGWITVALIFCVFVPNQIWADQLQELPDFKEVRRVGQSALYQGWRKAGAAVQGDAVPGGVCLWAVDG